MFSKYLLFVIIALLSITSVSAKQATDITIFDQDLTVTQFSAEGAHLIIWVAPGYGSTEKVFRFADSLVEHGIETWHIDLIDNLFLPKGTKSIRSLNGKYIAGLIKYAHEKTGKKIALMTRSYGAIPVLRGAREWQLQQQALPEFRRKAYLTGAILFSPDMNRTVPPLGVEAELVPVSKATNIPVIIYQAGKRGNRWQLNKIISSLKSGNAKVYSKIIEDITGVFYARDTSLEAEEVLASLPEKFPKVLQLLDETPTPLIAGVISKLQRENNSGLNVTLSPYQGNPEPLPLNMVSSSGERVTRDNYKGKITVINFWASWCPPCVDEIPSLNNLRENMKGLPFELISVNYAEEEQTIKEFLQQVDVDFPVLLDPDGHISSNWRVIVFPATFVIGPSGKIRYGVNGAIKWDNPDILKTLNKLLH